MKKLLFFALLAITTTFFSSCHYYQKHRRYSKDIDTTVEKIKLADTGKMSQPVSLPANSTAQQSTGFGYGSDKYYMIVGSFLNQALAEKYAEKIQQMGYHTQILQSSKSYYRVSAESFSNYKTGVHQISEFREKISSNAWLHVKKEK